MKTYLILISLVFIVSCAEDKVAYRKDLNSVFDSVGYEGGFVLLDIKSSKKTYVNQKYCSQKYSPASTFKIPHSLIALETKAVSTIHDTIRYNGIPKDIPEWNQDHDLASAFKNSVVWYYQDMANRIGDSAMKFWLDTLKDYGTMLRPGDLDKFWLDGSLVISLDEQVNFLEKLAENKLPFRKGVLDTAKTIMIFEKKPTYTIYAKTGLSNTSNVGWFVGWVEKKDNKFVFATNIKSKDSLSSKFMADRVLITKELLKRLRVI
ncbi:class D beta-lactamase [Candidatus Kapaibacterium sp.]